MSDPKDSETYFAEVVPFTGEQEPGNNLIPLPQAPMLQTKTQYHTAVSVQKPRDLDKVVAAVKREAALAGEAFYWSWPVKVKNKQTGKYETKSLDGPSIGLAMCVAREWTNVAIPVDYQETPTHDIFTAHFVDLERGFTVSRIWKQSKKVNKDLDSYGDRAVNMTFQAAQSRAIRNVVLAGVPKWLVDQAKEIAKDSVLKKITPEKIAAARVTIIQIMKNHGVDEARIVAALDNLPVAQWGPEEIVSLKGMSTQIREGAVSADELFPPIEEKDISQGKEHKPRTDKGTSRKPPGSPTPPDVANPGTEPESPATGNTEAPTSITDAQMETLCKVPLDILEAAMVTCGIAPKFPLNELDEETAAKMIAETVKA